jgi:hypothetical protein
MNRGKTMSAVIELQGCECCGEEKNMQTMERMADGRICLDCYVGFKTNFDACDHEWRPDIDDMGDHGQCCLKCSGFVCDDSFAELFGTAPPSRS